ncbi:BRO-N domain-containing protein [Rickettsia conorii]|uniref:phage antirepressor n=1 Tax=Rickettsia conorii TaxID=781 RepID=UPI0003018FAA|nr:phage antirepressor [Rickettsia conorii]
MSRTEINCHRWKKYITDCANTESLLRIIQFILSPKAEPFKQWLAKVGYERIQEISDPEKSIDRARDNWKRHGHSEKWI